MRYAGDALNKALIKLLEIDNLVEEPVGTQISVYTEVPLNSSFPMIILEPTTATEEDVSKSNVDQSHVINVEVVSKFNQGDGGWGANNRVINQITQLVRGIGVTMDLSADGFKVTTQTIRSIQPIRESYDDGVYFRTILILEIVIQDTTE